MNMITTLKGSLVKVLAIILAFISPISALILTVMACVGVDTILGIMRAVKRKEGVSSRKLSHIVSKTVLYVGSIILVFAIEKFIVGDIVALMISVPLFLTKLMSITLVGIEMVSIKENVQMITGVDIWVKFKDILKRTKAVKQEIESVTHPSDEEDNQPTDIV